VLSGLKNLPSKKHKKDEGQDKGEDSEEDPEGDSSNTEFKEIAFGLTANDLLFAEHSFCRGSRTPSH
jgi:hypothetical protein